jgi:hypothetical protein
MAAEPPACFVASLRCPVEPLIHAPEDIRATRIGGVRVVDDIILERERAHPRRLPRVYRRVREQEAVLGVHHRVVVAVGDEDRLGDGCQATELRRLGDPQRVIAVSCASRMARSVGSSRSLEPRLCGPSRHQLPSTFARHYETIESVISKMLTPLSRAIDSSPGSATANRFLREDHRERSSRVRRQRADQLRTAPQTALSGGRPAVDEMGVRPVVTRRGRPKQRRHTGAPPQRYDALRRRLARRADRALPRLD